MSNTVGSQGEIKDADIFSSEEDIDLAAINKNEKMDEKVNMKKPK